MISVYSIQELFYFFYFHPITVVKIVFNSFQLAPFETRRQGRIQYFPVCVHHLQNLHKLYVTLFAIFKRFKAEDWAKLARHTLALFVNLCDLSNIPLVWPFSVYFLPVVLYLFSVVGSGSVWLGDTNTSSSSSLSEKSQSSKCFIEETKDWPWVHGSALFLMASSKIKKKLSSSCSNVLQIFTFFSDCTL